jgi:hypothetical protein
MSREQSNELDCFIIRLVWDDVRAIDEPLRIEFQLRIVRAGEYFFRFRNETENEHTSHMIHFSESDDSDEGY